MKRKLSFILAAVMLMALVLQPVSAVSSGETRIPFSGKGSIDNPYLISSAEGLRALSVLAEAGLAGRGVYFALDADIDLNDEPFTPIGSEEHPFEAELDGRGHTVSGLRVGTSLPYAGLFGYSTGAISGIVLRGSVAGAGAAGGIVGHGSAEYCVSYASVAGRTNVGGIAGEGEAYDCTAYGSVAGETNVGGLAGSGEAHRSSAYGSVAGQFRTGALVGMGVSFDCFSPNSAEETETAEPEKAKHSVASFIRWALTHIDPDTIPTNADLFLAASSCGASPWEYLYGSVRVSTSQTTINSFFNNYYTTYMTRTQYDDITEDWSRSTYACDCQGLLDAWMTHVEGVTTDLNVQMNYSNWCTNKGEISSITRDWVVGEAVFVYSTKLQKMSHIGWVCGFDETGEPLVVEARGVGFGVVVTRLSDRSWTHRGLMTVQFNYDASMKSSFTMPAPESEEEYDDARLGSVGEVWDGSVSKGFAGGSGTASDPYVISNASQLAYLSSSVASGTTYYNKYIVLSA
ncbi:MAG: hypothetical protein J6P98_07870, partial [Clostridia bacterium]|nr:hypothetical protein [Clostridia bacterium]